MPRREPGLSTGLGLLFTATALSLVCPVPILSSVNTERLYSKWNSLNRSCCSEKSSPGYLKGQWLGILVVASQIHLNFNYRLCRYKEIFVVRTRVKAHVGVPGVLVGEVLGDGWADPAAHSCRRAPGHMVLLLRLHWLWHSLNLCFGTFNWQRNKPEKKGHQFSESSVSVRAPVRE